MYIEDLVQWSKNSDIMTGLHLLYKFLGYAFLTQFWHMATTKFGDPDCYENESRRTLKIQFVMMSILLIIFVGTTVTANTIPSEEASISLYISSIFENILAILQLPLAWPTITRIYCWDLGFTKTASFPPKRTLYTFLFILLFMLVSSPQKY
mmetsp:Transcript_121951/g.182095  ORF Transcript_121951/g.182095 Transcript_121951/m.182095 type:complete len:152 (+) Transcript_121951:345-800(+)